MWVGERILVCECVCWLSWSWFSSSAHLLSQSAINYSTLFGHSIWLHWVPRSEMVKSSWNNGKWKTKCGHNNIFQWELIVASLVQRDLIVLDRHRRRRRRYCTILTLSFSNQIRNWIVHLYSFFPSHSIRETNIN